MFITIIKKSPDVWYIALCHTELGRYHAIMWSIDMPKIQAERFASQWALQLNIPYKE